MVSLSLFLNCTWEKEEERYVNEHIPSESEWERGLFKNKQQDVTIQKRKREDEEYKEMKGGRE